MSYLKSIAKTATGTVLATLMATTAMAEDKVTAVHAFPGFLVYTKTFLAMVDDINARGKGVVQIEVKGGPEAIGMFEQPAAVRDGVIDMVHTPGSFYGASVPEIDAMVAATVTPMEARANGGAAAMDMAHQKRFNVKHLGWIDGGIQFYIYSTTEPKFGDDGVLDLSGVKLRDNPIYSAFFGLRDLKWDEFVKYRTAPAFYNTDLGVIFNMDSWNALSPESQTLIQDVVIEWEAKSFEDRQKEVGEETTALEAGGLTTVEHSAEGAAKYLELAGNAAWSRMKGRLDEMGDEGTYDLLRKHYYGE